MEGEHTPLWAQMGAALAEPQTPGLLRPILCPHLDPCALQG